MKRIVILMSCFAAGVACSAEFHVSPNGSDSASGTAASPFATLHRAIGAARQSPGADRVIVHDGLYRIDKTLSFGPEDSDVHFVAAEGARPVVSGSVRLTEWRTVEPNHYVASVPWVVSREKGFRRLSVNGERRGRARYPDEGFLKACKDDLPAEAKYNEPRPNLYYAPGDLDAGWKNLSDAEIVMHHFWNDSHLRIAGVDPHDRRIRLVSPCGKSFSTGWSNNEVGDNPGLYVIENIPAALNLPGEWYLDYAAREVHYLTKDGEDPRVDVVTVPVLARLVDIAGEPEKDGRWVERVSFTGFIFREAQYELPVWNVNNAQGASETGSAIAIRGARQCSFDRCVFTDHSAYAVLFGPGAWNNTLQRSTIAETGGGGVRLAGGLWNDHPFKQTRGNVISDCEITRWGQDFKSSCGVMGQHAEGTRVLHNHIHDAHYMGISFGWNWGYCESVSWGTEIGWNHVHDLGKGDLLSDMGGIYTLGVQPGTRIHHNHLHHISARCYGGWGIYQDEGATHAVVENNLVHHTKHAAYNIHFAKEILVRNNIFAYGRHNQLQRQRREPHKSLYFFNNIVVWDSKQFMTGDWSDAPDKTYRFYYLFFMPQYKDLWSTFEIDRNIYWNAGISRDELRIGGEHGNGITWQEWQALGKDPNSLFADPKIRDAENGDFTLSEDSPALALGFVPFDLSGAGPRTPPPRL